MQQQQDNHSEEWSQEEVPYTLGLATFSSYCPKIHDQMPQQIKTQFEQKSWWFQIDISETRINEHSIKVQKAEMLQNIIEAQCEQFYLDVLYNQDKSFLKSSLLIIVKINFPYLTILQLSDVNLLNLESIAFMDMDKLQSLTLYAKNMTSLKALSKSKWDLESFQMRGKRIQQVDLSRVKMKDRLIYLGQDIFYEDLSKMVKFETQKIGRFQLHEEQSYLKQRIIVNKLRQRFLGTKIEIRKGHIFIINPPVANWVYEWKDKVV